MSENQQEEQTPFVFPELDREEIKNSDDVPYLGFEDYGNFTLALRHLKPSSTKIKAYLRGHFNVVASTNPLWPVGREMCLHFHTRYADGAAAWKQEKADRYLASFVKAICGKASKAEGFSTKAAGAKLVAMGKREDDALQVRMTREPGQTKTYQKKERGVVVTDAEGKVVMVTKTFEDDKFFAV